MLRAKIKPRNEPVVFVDCGPTILANILTKSFHTNRFKDLFSEMAVRAVKEINAFCHGESLSVDRMWLDYSSSKNARCSRGCACHAVVTTKAGQPQILGDSW
jgi:hypothetical protein